MAFAVLALAGCGRISFELSSTGADAAAGADASTLDGPDASTASFALVQGTSGSGTSMASMVTIPRTLSGNLLVVGVAQESGTTATVAMITDDVGNTYVSANQRSIDASCANTTEIWYATNVRADASAVNVSMSENVTIQVWVAEFAGPSGAAPLDTGAIISTQPDGPEIAAPVVTPSSPDALVISTAATCGAISAVKPGSPFTALAILDGENTAYYVAHALGSYGAVWNYSGGSWDASTVAFR
jgi:hypothetical protein